MYTISLVAAGYSVFAPDIHVSSSDSFVSLFSWGEAPAKTLVIGSSFELVEILPDVLAPAANSRYCAVTVNVDDWEWAKFQSLKGNWLKERGSRSSISESSMSPSYQRIIAMGPVVIPMILRELEYEGDDPDQWFWALQALTLADPVTDNIRGNFQLMAKAWIAWARTKGYAW